MKDYLLAFGIGAVFSVIVCGIFGVPIINGIATIACCAGSGLISYYIIKLVEKKK